MKKAILTVLTALLFTTAAYAVTTQVQTSVTVTNASAVIIPAVTWGHDVFIQNNDASGIVYLNLSGVATADNTMVVLNPGDSFAAQNITNAVQAIGSIASNANVAVLEGK